MWCKLFWNLEQTRDLILHDLILHFTHGKIVVMNGQPNWRLLNAQSNQDLPVLRRLLNYQRSSLNPQETLQLASSIRDERDEKPHLEAVLTLLLPEATFPESAIHDLCKAAGHGTPRVFLFLLDKKGKVDCA